MTRAAILPTPTDPFLLNYWLMLFETVWADEIDRLYIMANGVDQMSIAYYITERTESDKIYLDYTRDQMEHGDAIKRALMHVDEDLVMLIEDDAFIFGKDVVNYCFGALESGNFDVVGSKRGSCGTQILELASARWGIPYDGYGDQGPNFWPCYFFTPTNLLRKVNNFGARMWFEGQLIEPFGVKARGDQAGDTFVEASLQIRDMVPGDRILHVPQYHLHPDDWIHYQNRESIWDQKARWLHVGSLSTGYNRLLDPDMPLDHHPVDDFQKREYERRVQWWMTFWENREKGKLDDEAERYKAGIDRLIVEFGLSTKRILQRKRIFGEVFHGF